MTTDLFRSEAMERFHARPWQPPLLSKPVSGPLLAVVALAAAAAFVAFGTSFQFARKEQARGYLVPESGWSRVSTRFHGVVQRLLVEPGDRVRTGDVLLELSPGDGLGRSRTVERDLLERLRGTWEVLEARMRLIDARHKVDRALHVSQRQADESQLDLLKEEIERHGSRLATARRRHRDGQRLAADGSLAEADVLALADEVDARRLIASEKEREANRIRSVLADGDDRLRRLDLDAERDRLALSERIHDLAMEESRIRGQETARVLAPRDGIVASVRAGVGDRLQPGALLLDIVPEDGVLQARLFARSAAMGFVETGQEVRVHLDAFPYQRHGAQTGRVLAISETTLPPGEAGVLGDAGPGLGVPVGPTYRIDVAFPTGFNLAPSQRAALRAGMTLSADLVRDRSTLLDWMLEPLRGTAYRL